eukprot:40848_1
MSSTFENNSFRSIIVGSCFVTLGQLLFSTNSAIVKYSGLKESQLLFGRFGIHTLISICYWIILKYSSQTHANTFSHWYGEKPYIKSIWLRGFTFTINQICFWYAIIRLPIGDAECIFYQTPIVIAMFGWIFLKETLPKTTPIICLLGVAGVLCISQPQFITAMYTKTFHAEDEEDVAPLNADGVLSMVTAVFAWSITAILIRQAKGSHFLQLDIVAGIQTMFISTPTVLLVNHYFLHNAFIGDLDFNDWVFDMRSTLLILLLGVVGFGALTCSIVGYQYADATKVAWLEYTTLLFAFSYQIFLFGDIPNTLEVIGVIFVLLACVVSILEELYKKYLTNKISYSVLHNIATSQSEDDSQTE